MKFWTKKQKREFLLKCVSAFQASFFFSALCGTSSCFVLSDFSPANAHHIFVQSFCRLASFSFFDILLLYPMHGIG